jgi:Na+/H+-dicarboxylate symporter
MSALYISQLIGQHLSLEQQLIVILISIFASVGAANIPNAGLVTMTLVFTSVGLSTERGLVLRLFRYLMLLRPFGITFSSPATF